MSPPENQGAPILSVIIPVYNETARIGSTLQKVRAYAEERPEAAKFWSWTTARPTTAGGLWKRSAATPRPCACCGIR